MTRLPLIATLCLTLATPGHAQVIENEQMVVYANQWVQMKTGNDGAALMFLTVERGEKGEYFSIRCEMTGGKRTRSIRLGFPSALKNAVDAPAPITVEIDGKSYDAMATFTGTTRDDAYTKSDIHGYELSFAKDTSLDATLKAMKAGNVLKVQGQSLPVSLKGFTAALKGQDTYCK